MRKLILLLGFLLAGTAAESSILSDLRQMGNYTYFLRLVEEADTSEWGYYTTGGYSITSLLDSRNDITAFVSDDDGWQRFFEENAKLPTSNPWHTATSYEALTSVQKSQLCLCAVTTYNVNKPDEIRFSSGTNCAARVTHLAGSDLPFTYSQNEKWYWERFHEAGGGSGIYLASDSSYNYTSFLTREKTLYHTLTQDDCNIIFGKSLYHVVWNDGWNMEIIDDITGLANGEEIQQKTTASNGTIYSVATPVRPLPSMADIIRTNGRTNIFSHILDRFSAPYYCHSITWAYREYYPESTDSVFIKRYFSENNYSTKAGYVQPGSYFEPAPFGTYQTYNPYKYNPDLIPTLKFDPGWSAYCNNKTPEQDMAAMFVPTDDEMWRFFTTGLGLRPIYTYYTKEGTADEIPYTAPTSLEELYQQIDAIPVGTLYSLVNIHMQTSFVGSVPSKWSRLTDDAGECLFDAVDWAREQLDTCLLASNGVVYVMDMTLVPADFCAVTAPAFISNDTKIMKSAIYGSFMNMNYDAYLKDMRTRYSLFLPTDDALTYYYDAASMKSRTPRVMRFYYSSGEVPVKPKFYNYYCPYNKDKGDLGTIGYQIPGASLYTNEETTNRLKDILESHTIVQDDTNPMTRQELMMYGYVPYQPLSEWYLSKNGCPIKVVRDEEDNVIAVKGGFQLENERLGIEPDVAANGVLNCPVAMTNETNNGCTFVLNAPLVPTWRSVWSIFTNDADMEGFGLEGFGGETPYSAFYDLCIADAHDTEIIGCGLVDASLDDMQQQAELKKYKIFVADNGLDYNVSFFNNYRYTVFVPTNEAVQEAIAAGLPTWESICADYHSHCIEGTDVLATYEDSVRIATKITYLTDFVRNHFADGSVFADKPELMPKEMVTACYDQEAGQFGKLHVDRVTDGNDTYLRVCDDVTWKENGSSMTGAFTIVGEKNVLARDISCSKSPAHAAMRDIIIDASSSAVIHSIPGCLNHTKLIGGRHDTTWEQIVIDAIRNVKAGSTDDGSIYDLSGQMVNGKLPPGIYIQSGKKIALTKKNRL